MLLFLGADFLRVAFFFAIAFFAVFFLDRAGFFFEAFFAARFGAAFRVAFFLAIGVRWWSHPVQRSRSASERSVGCSLVAVPHEQARS